MKTGGRLIKHARYYWLQLAESHLTGRFCGINGSQSAADFGETGREGEIVSENWVGKAQLLVF